MPFLHVKTGRYAYLSILAFLIMTAIALTVGLQYYFILAEPEAKYTIGWHIWFNLFYFWCWLFLLPGMRWMAARWHIEHSKLLYWFLFYGLIPVAIVLLHQIIAALVINLVLGFMEFRSLVTIRILRNSWVWVDLIIYFSIMTGIQLEEYRFKNERNVIRISHLRTQLTHSRINALKSQIHPHFLFNTLNTLSTLILKKDNREAERMLTLLQRFLYRTLHESDRNEIRLEEELRFINHYLEIEKVRFKDKLQVQESIEPDALQAQVPTFLLQPIVENAIHHAIAKRTSGGKICITATHQDHQLCITVDDNGPGTMSPQRHKPNEGVGLKITKERLTQLYGEHHSIQLQSSALGGMSVQIRVPYTFLPSIEKDPLPHAG